MSTHSHRPTIVEVDNIDPLDSGKTAPLLDPLRRVLKSIPEHKPTDVPFQQSFSEPRVFPLDGRLYPLLFTVNVDDSVDSLGGVQPTSLSSNFSYLS
jgi:hypothetical protein